MARATLDDVLGGEDAFGLLDVAPAATRSEHGEAGEVFQAVEAFIEAHGRPPDLEAQRDFTERLLATKARRVANNDAQMGALLQPVEDSPPVAIDDILDDAMLDDDPIFTLRNVSTRKAVDAPDYIAGRKSCSDFDTFRPLFEAAAADLTARRRMARPFAREQEIDAGQFFIVRGQTAYVAEAGEPFRDSTGDNNRRLRVIYDNGTEGDPLLRSFASALYNDENGRRITDPVAGPLFKPELEEADVQTGHVYVARTLSNDPAIVPQADRIIKIGVTGGDVHRRVADAANDATFLLAPATIVTSFTLYNINRTKLEGLLHRFFEPVRADIAITDRFGKAVHPREWFYATPDMVTEAVRRIQDGTIVRCYVDREGVIVDTASI
ncbi:MAG: GIY-YIG nuclease family protein [Pontixanthobacter sp.]